MEILKAKALAHRSRLEQIAQAMDNREVLPHLNPGGREDPQA